MLRNDRAAPLAGPDDDHRRPPPTRASRAGTTVAELIAVLTVVGLLGAVTLPRLSRALDGIAVHSAISAIASACAVARSAAIMRGAVATVSVDPAGRRVTVSVGADTILTRALDEPPYRLTLAVSQTTIAYGPTGLGFGVANTSVVARQGAVADTLYTSRLGRVRH